MVKVRDDIPRLANGAVDIAAWSSAVATDGHDLSLIHI